MTPPACYPENFPAAVQGAGTQEELPDSLNKGGRTKGPGEQSDRIHSTVLVKEEVHIEKRSPTDLQRFLQSSYVCEGNCRSRRELKSSGALCPCWDPTRLERLRTSRHGGELVDNSPLRRGNN